MGQTLQRMKEREWRGIEIKDRIRSIERIMSFVLILASKESKKWKRNKLRNSIGNNKENRKLWVCE